MTGALLASAFLELGLRAPANEAVLPAASLEESIRETSPRPVPERTEVPTPEEEDVPGGIVASGERAGIREPALPRAAISGIPRSWRIRHATLFRSEPARPSEGPLLAPEPTARRRSRPDGFLRALSLVEEDLWPSFVLAEDTPSERFARGILTTVARYRYAPQPTLSVDSDTGTILIGLTWRR